MIPTHNTTYAIKKPMSWIAAAVAAALLTSAVTAHAATVVGTGTYMTADDLTKIRLDSGDVVEWLDISDSVGHNVSSAIAAFGPDGFHVATIPEFVELHNAFGLPTVEAQFGIANANNFIGTFDGAAVDEFQNFLGTTVDNATETISRGYHFDVPGGFIDRPDLGHFATPPSPGMILGSYGHSPDASNDPTSGVWLLRPMETTVVPEPVSACLAALGVTALVMYQRRRRAAV